jgi:hypothetical protein
MAEASGFITDTAQGRIEIDLSQVRQAKDIFVRAIAEMDSAVDTFSPHITRTEKTTVATLQNISKAANDTFKIFQQASAGATAFGVSATRSVGRIKDQFRILTGDAQKSAMWMDQIRQAADDTHQAFLPLLEGVTNMVPLLRNSNAEFGDMLMLMQQLASADPSQGMGGAAYALREFFGGQYRSLVQRFELPAQELQKISKQYEGDMAGMISALQAYLDELGYTTDAIEEFGAAGHNSFQILKSEAMETAASAFTPLNDAINEMANGLSNALKSAREYDRGLLPIVGTMTALVGLSQAANLGNMIPGVSIPGGATLAKVGVGAASLYGGAQAGAYIAREAGAPGTEGKTQDEVLQGAMDTFKQALVGAFNTLVDIGGILLVGKFVIGNAFDVVGASIELGASIVGNALADLTNAIGDGAAAVLEGFAKFLEGLEFSESLDLGFKKITLGVSFGSLPDDLRQSAEDAKILGDNLRTSDETMQGYNDRMKQGITLTDEQGRSIEKYTEGGKGLVQAFAEGIGAIDEYRSGLDILNDGVGTIIGGLKEGLLQARDAVVAQRAEQVTFTDEQIEAFGKYQDDLTAIEEQGEEDRLDLIASYKERRSSIVEDEQLRRTQAEKDLARNIGKVNQSLDQKISSLAADHTARMVEIAQTRHKALIDAQEDYEDQLADLEKNARRDRLMAIARFDAWGLFRANQDYEDRKDELDDSLSDEIDTIREQYEERLQLEIDSNAERLQAARDAAQQQIDDLNDNFNYQEGIRSAAYARELSTLDTKHQQELTALQANIAAQKQERDNQFLNEFNAMLGHNSQMLLLQGDGLKDLETGLENWYKQQAAKFGTVGTVTSGITTTARNVVSTVASGIRGLFPGGSGILGQSGLYSLGAGELIMGADTVSYAKNVLGTQNLTQPALMNALGGQGGSSVDMSGMEINITIDGSGNDNAELADMVAEATREEIIAIAGMIGGLTG